MAIIEQRREELPLKWTAPFRAKDLDADTAGYLMSFVLPTIKEMPNLTPSFSRHYWEPLDNPLLEGVFIEQHRTRGLELLQKIADVYRDLVRIKRAFCIRKKTPTFAPSVFQERTFNASFSAQQNYVEFLFVRHVAAALSSHPSDYVQLPFQKARQALLSSEKVSELFHYHVNSELLRFLLNRFGAHPSTDHLFLHIKNRNVIQELIRKSADVNGQSSSGSTLLHHLGKLRYWTPCGNDEGLEKHVRNLVDMLLKNGANPNILDHEGHTPLDEQKFPSVRELIQNAGGRTSTSADKTLVYRRRVARNVKRLGLSFFMGMAIGQQIRKFPSEVDFYLFLLSLNFILILSMEDCLPGNPIVFGLGVFAGYISIFKPSNV